MYQCVCACFPLYYFIETTLARGHFYDFTVVKSLNNAAYYHYLSTLPQHIEIKSKFTTSSHQQSKCV